MALKYKPHLRQSSVPLRLLKDGGFEPQLAERLWAAIYLPQLALDVLTDAPDAAVCKVDQAGRAVVIVANPAAQTLGVQQGQTVSAARALSPDLKVFAQAPEREQAAVEKLAQACYGISAWVHIAESNMLLLELKASLKLFGGLENLLAVLREAISQYFEHFFVAVAPTPSMAMLLAKVGDETPLLYPQQTAGRLAQVPLTVMPDTDPKCLARLQKLGLQHYGELLRLPRAGLQKRFGVALGDYIRCLLGEKPECPEAWSPPAQYQSSQSLQDELSHSAQLLPVLLVMLADMCQWLQQRSARIQRFSVRLYGHKQCLSSFDVAFLRPNNRVEAMQKLLELRLEREVLAAPVVSITVFAEQLVYPQALSVGQQSLWVDQHSTDESWWDSLETIQARLGADAVTGVACQDEHRPEMAWQEVMPGERKSAQSPAGERPLWLFEKPRKLSGAELRQLCLQSRPERIASGWWDNDAVYRDYFVAQVSHQRLWVFRDVAQEPAQWFCHGVFR